MTRHVYRHPRTGCQVTVDDPKMQRIYERHGWVAGFVPPVTSEEVMQGKRSFWQPRKKS